MNGKMSMIKRGKSYIHYNRKGWGVEVLEIMTRRCFNIEEIELKKIYIEAMEG